MSRLSPKLAVIFTVLLIIGLVEAALIWWIVDRRYDSAERSNSSQSENTKKPFDTTRYPVNDAASVWAVVNKGRQLPADYSPKGLTVPDVQLRGSPSSDEMHLRSDAARALKNLFNAAANAGVNLRLASGYRSYNLQSIIYSREVRTYGQTEADRQSARQGHSEHQTGLAADIGPLSGNCEIKDCFADTAEGKWLAANAHKFGFVVRYPKGGEKLTGYRYEPWHFRYVGKALATELKKTGQTMEQFFGLRSYRSYPSDIYELR